MQLLIPRNITNKVYFNCFSQRYLLLAIIVVIIILIIIIIVTGIIILMENSSKFLYINGSCGEICQALEIGNVLYFKFALETSHIVNVGASSLLV